MAARDISIHALLAESDAPSHSLCLRNKNFYPRSPCGERRKSNKLTGSKLVISIHALLAESDGAGLLSCFAKILFLSTLSLRRATIVSSALLAIHTNFYPRSPCGERPASGFFIGSRSQFLSTLSLRRATCYSLRHSASRRHFYPRSPCGERQFRYVSHMGSFAFLSTLSLRRATSGARSWNSSSGISIHALLAESDQPLPERFSLRRISIHALLAESDLG